MLKDSTFYVLAIAGFLAFSGRIYTQIAYKIYGAAQGHDDVFLSLVGTILNLASGPSRIFWSGLIDCVGFKRVSLVNFTFTALFYLTVNFIAYYKTLYLIWITAINI